VVALKLSPELRGQFAAIGRLRWQLIVNALRTIRGRLELISGAFIGLVFALAGLGGGFGFAAGAWYFTTSGETWGLAILTWAVFLFWQLFLVMATAFTEVQDPTNLLRFPLTYRRYFAISVIYGSLDGATALGSLWLLGIVTGVAAGDLRLLPWTILVAAVFAAVNILLARTIFAWVERWLAQRKTREIMTILIVMLMIGFQLVGPLMGRYAGRRPTDRTVRAVAELSPLQRVLPPGLAAASLASMSHGQIAASLIDLAILCTYGLVFLRVLDVRLHSQYRGENLGDPAARNGARTASPVKPGWDVPGLSGPVTAIVEKEFRYLARSGPMLFTLIMPLVMLLIFRLGPAGRDQGFLMRAPDLAFPVGAAYALLMLTNLVYNNFGADSSGIQLFFAAPVSFRKIVVAKNLAHLTVLMFEIILVYIAVAWLYRPPALDITAATLAGVLLAAPVNLAAGNLLSLYSPKRVEYGKFGKLRASQATVLASFGIQILVFGLGAIVLLVSRFYGDRWLAPPIFLGLALIAWIGYLLLLKHAERAAMDRREILLGELSRA